VIEIAKQYTVGELAELAGVSTRTLRYYDEIGLLVPERRENGYRIYGSTQVDRLQEILFFRELGVPAGEIKALLDAEGYDRLAALRMHREALAAERARIDKLIANAEKTIAEMEGKLKMSDKEKFEGFKAKLIEENEKKYGAETRAKYGDEAVDASNAKLRGLTPEQHRRLEELTTQINAELARAAAAGDPESEQARRVAELHREWLTFFWTDYSKEKHLGLARMYLADPRFKAYYDAAGEGCCEFLVRAIEAYCKE
jgi:DNA-binding transcriptional MerR regulator